MMKEGRKGGDDFFWGGDGEVKTQAYDDYEILKGLILDVPLSCASCIYHYKGGKYRL